LYRNVGEKTMQDHLVPASIRVAIAHAIVETDSMLSIGAYQLRTLWRRKMAKMGTVLFARSLVCIADRRLRKGKSTLSLAVMFCFVLYFL
jgi:hypothetical protein